MANYTSHVGAKRNVDGKLMGAVHFTLLHFTLLHEVDQEWKKKEKSVHDKVVNCDHGERHHL